MPIPTIKEPGIYDMPADDYHADPCVVPSLSASIAKILIQETPLHAFTAHPRLNPNYEREEDSKFDIGNSAHSLILNDPKKFAILAFDDWRKKEAQQLRDEARAMGKIPLLAHHWDRVNVMVSAARLQLDASPDFSDVFKNGKPEQTLIWMEDTFQGQKVDPIWFRIRVDWLPDDRTKPYDDYKTTESADPDTWSRVVFSVRHDIQASLYRRGLRALGLNRQPVMRFVVQETTDPFCLCVMRLSSEIMELADRDVDRAIRKWLWCRKNNAWPGYPAKVHLLEAPAWLEDQRMKRETRQQETADREKVDPDLLELGFRMQAPI